MLLSLNRCYAEEFNFENLNKFVNLHYKQNMKSKKSNKDQNQNSDSNKAIAISESISSIWRINV